MQTTTLSIKNRNVSLITAGVAVVGSGAAALNAAVHLKKLGVDDLVLLTEKLKGGTSANAGSDKQTYYRLNPTASDDSALRMAQDLFAGGCMHGDIAFVEAALSMREFYHLVELGVPFPQNRYGAFTGFQTDHDHAGRGTSAGPKTSILMAEKLLEETKKEGVEILDHLQVIELLTESGEKEKRITGLLAIDSECRPVVIRSDYVVYGTGGPGALYADSVYPYSQVGSLGIALKAGAIAQNLSESQFGIASTGFRWNLSGSYQQVVPRYLSTDARGVDTREFLNDWFPSLESQCKAQFLKGYQWPFDVMQLADHGSSVIDLAVYIESRCKGRTVYVDFSKNTEYKGTSFAFESLPPPVKEYLERSGATGNTPVRRLKQMNLPAYELFCENGIDLETHPLEIAICHQHCNGGLAGSIWWESNLIDFFPVGECCGTHGVYRPGGSALNSGQVGSLRAAEMIRYRISRREDPQPIPFSGDALKQIEKRLDCHNRILKKVKPLDIEDERKLIQSRMSESLSILRDADRIEKAILTNQAALDRRNAYGVKNRSRLAAYLKNEDLLITERAFLKSAQLLLSSLKAGRGSYLIGDLEHLVREPTDAPIEIHIDGKLPDLSEDSRIVQYRIDDEGIDHLGFEQVRPIPEEHDWFEKVWKDFRENLRFWSEQGFQ